MHSIVWRREELIGEIKRLARSYGVALSKATPQPVTDFEYLIEELGMAPKRGNRTFFNSLKPAEQQAVAWMLAESLEKAKVFPAGSAVNIPYGMFGWLSPLLLGTFTLR